MSVDIEVEVIVECENCGYELDANYEMRYRNNARRPVLIVKPCELRCAQYGHADGLRERRAMLVAALAAAAVWTTLPIRSERSMTEPYRPANGSEGMDFFDAYCERCERNRKYCETDDGADCCKILAASMLYNIGEPGYPAEWIYGEDGYPTCTAFEEKVKP